MLKKGFTLAEVLVTLGIIGVVAALTLPGILTDTTSAQIGPKLAKARKWKRTEFLKTPRFLYVFGKRN